MSGEAWLRSSDRLTQWTTNCLVNVLARKPCFLELFCHHPWLLARPPALRVCARAVRARPVHQPARAAKASPGFSMASRRCATRLPTCPLVRDPARLAQRLEQVAHVVTLLLGREIGWQRMVELGDDLRTRARTHAQQLQYQLLEHAVIQAPGSHVVAVRASCSSHLGRYRELRVAPPSRACARAAAATGPW